MHLHLCRLTGRIFTASNSLRLCERPGVGASGRLPSVNCLCCNCCILWPCEDSRDPVTPWKLETSGWVGWVTQDFEVSVVEHLLFVFESCKGRLYFWSYAFYAQTLEFSSLNVVCVSFSDHRVHWVGGIASWAICGLACPRGQAYCQRPGGEHRAQCEIAEEPFLWHWERWVLLRCFHCPGGESRDHTCWEIHHTGVASTPTSASCQGRA